MNILELESKLELISNQIKEYNEVKRVATLVMEGKEKPTHELFRCSLEMTEIILNNLHKEYEEIKSKLQSEKVYVASGGYPLGKIN